MLTLNHRRTGWFRRGHIQEQSRVDGRALADWRLRGGKDKVVEV